MKAWNYLQKILCLPLKIDIIKQPHGLMMEDEKDVLAGEYRKSPAFAGYHIFAPAGHIERYKEPTIFRFHETKKDTRPGTYPIVDVLTTCCASSKRIAKSPTHITLFDVNIDSLKNIKNVLNFVTQAWKRPGDVMIQMLLIDGAYSRVK